MRMTKLAQLKHYEVFDMHYKFQEITKMVHFYNMLMFMIYFLPLVNHFFNVLIILGMMKHTLYIHGDNIFF